jgi:hypothetical protein
MKWYFRRKIIFISAGAAIENIYDAFVEPERVRFYTRISVENLNSAMTEFRIGADSGREFYQCEEQDSPAAATLYWTDKILYVFGGDRLQVRVTGATSGDRLELILQGYEEKREAIDA